MLVAESDDVTSLLDRGSRLSASGFTTEAYQVFLTAFEQAPQSTKVQSRVGDFLLRRGELEDAQRFFSLAATGGDIAGLCGLVEVRERQGQLDAAWALLEQVPGAIEQSLAVRSIAARILARTGQPQQALALLTAVDPTPLNDNDAAGILHQLGDLHAELGHPERAFDAWTRANRRRRLDFDRVAHAKAVDVAIERYDAGSFDRFPTGSTSARPVFIVGIPRSGTSLVEQILATHPEVHGGGELPDISALSTATDPDNAEQIGRAAKSYLQRQRVLDRAALRVTDKMPFNAMQLGFIAQLFPNATIIHCVRDESDTALSIYGRNFSDWHDYATSLRNIANFTAEHERMMAHWRSVLPNPFLEVRYEELVQNGEDVMRTLIDHIGLGWDPCVMEFHRNTRTISTASYAQVQRPLYTTGIGRAKPYSKALRAFRNELARARTRTL